MKEVNKESQSGKSLTETLIVLVISAIIVTFAISQFGQSKDKYQRQNVARELKVDLERARFDSMKRHAMDDSSMAYVKINSANSFTIATDLNQNGIIDSFEPRQINFTNGNIKIVGTNLLFPIMIKFDKRGFITTIDGSGAAISPVLTICDNCTMATASSQNSNIISVSTSGTVQMSTGGSILPTLPTPNGSIISSGTQINSAVVVTPTPTPTGGQSSCTQIWFLCM